MRIYDMNERRGRATDSTKKAQKESVEILLALLTGPINQRTNMLWQVFLSLS